MSSTPDNRLAATLVTGFLGSGKTTLINAVLRSPGFANTLVIVNEFGEIGLDHLLIEGGQDQVILMDSGCLCCQMNGSLRDTLIDVFMRRSAASIPFFDRVIIETSGLANPVPLISILMADSAVLPRYRLDLVVTVIDALNGPQVLATYDEALRQVAVADRVVLSKTDLADPAAISAVRALLAGISDQLPITEWQPGQDPAPHFAAVGHDQPGHAARRPGCDAASVERAGGVQARENSPRSTGLHHGPLFGNIKGYAFTFSGTTNWAAYAAWTAAMTTTFRKKLLRCKGIVSVGAPNEYWIIQAVQGFFVPPVRYAPRHEDAGKQAHQVKQFIQCICDQISREELGALFPLLELTQITNGIQG